MEPRAISPSTHKRRVPSGHPMALVMGGIKQASENRENQTLGPLHQPAGARNPHGLPPGLGVADEE